MRVYLLMLLYTVCFQRIVLVIDRVVDYFGEEILCGDSTIDRTQLAERIFQDATALEWLESLLHPLVQSEWKDFISVDCSSFACVEIPLTL